MNRSNTPCCGSLFGRKTGSLYINTQYKHLTNRFSCITKRQSPFSLNLGPRMDVQVITINTGAAVSNILEGASGNAR